MVVNGLDIDAIRINGLGVAAIRFSMSAYPNPSVHINLLSFITAMVIPGTPCSIRPVSMYSLDNAMALETPWCDENDVGTTCWKNQVFWKKYLLTPMASAYSQSVSASAASNEQTWRIYI